MASYTTTNDVRSYYMGIIEDSDYVTDTDITRFIAEQSTIIDLKLKKKYSLPFSDSSDLAYLKIICEKMIVCKIDDIFRANLNEEENSKFRRSRRYCEEAEEMLNDILNGKIELNATQRSFKPMKYNSVEVEDEQTYC